MSLTGATSAAGSNFQAFNEVLGGRLKRSQLAPEPQTSQPQQYEPGQPTSKDEDTSSSDSTSRSIYKKGLGIETQVDVEAGSVTTVCAITSKRLQSLIKSLDAKITYRKDWDGRMLIREPFYGLFFARVELAEKLRSAKSEELKSEIDIVLRFIEKHFTSALVELQGLSDSNTISFRLLWTLFPPKTLTYRRLPTALHGVSYEECGVVQQTEYVSDTFHDVLRLTCDMYWFTGTHIHRVQTKQDIPEFSGVKPITAEALHHIPFSLLPEDEQRSVTGRLVERGKIYFSIFGQPVSVWEYAGPVQFHGDSLQNHMFSSLFSPPDRERITSAGDWIANERAVVDAASMGDFYNHESRQGPGIEPSEPAADEVYLTCPARLAVFLLDTSQWVDASLSGLRQVRWKPDPLDGVSGSQINEVAKMAREYSPFDHRTSLISTAGPRGAGLIFWLEGPMQLCVEFTRAVAEYAKKPFVRIDLLDFIITNKGTNFSARHMISKLRWQPVMMIENCAEIMERRAFTKPQLCEMSNKFFTLLHCFPGVLFLLPGNVADQDPMWEKLSFVTVHVDR